MARQASHATSSRPGEEPGRKGGEKKLPWCLVSQGPILELGSWVERRGVKAWAGSLVNSPRMQMRGDSRSVATQQGGSLGSKPGTRQQQRLAQDLVLGHTPFASYRDPACMTP